VGQTARRAGRQPPPDTPPRRLTPDRPSPLPPQKTSFADASQVTVGQRGFDRVRNTVIGDTEVSLKVGARGAGAGAARAAAALLPHGSRARAARRLPQVLRPPPPVL
jgi:hypothetical protein